MSKYVKNDSGVSKTYVGKGLADQEILLLTCGQYERWQKISRDTTSNVYADISSGDLKVSKNGTDWLSAADGLEWMQHWNSGAIGGNIAVHQPTDGQILQYNGTTKKWNAVDLSSISKYSHVVHYNDQNSFVEICDQNDWTTYGGFVFHGTNMGPILTAVKAYAYCKNSNKTGQIRIQDITNNQTICTGTIGHNSGVMKLWNFGTVSNVPSGESVLEIQGRKNPTNGERVFAWSIIFDFG